MNTHTGDTFADAYFENGAYVPEAMTAIEAADRISDDLRGRRFGVGDARVEQAPGCLREPSTNGRLVTGR